VLKGVLVGSIALGAIGAGLYYAAIEELDPRVDRVYAQAIGASAGMCSKAISALFGDDDWADDEIGGWRGVRVYRPEVDGWIPLAKLSAQSVEAGASGSQRPTRVVVLVHGLDEPGGIWDQLAPALAKEGHTVLRFDYANDQPIAKSAEALEAGFVSIHEAGIERVDLVCHSMGGLVGFDALTRDGFGDLGLDVGHFITIGTPFGGSPWARLRAVAEIREQVQRWVESDDLDPRRLMGFARDGVGQAGRDLLPGSAYLKGIDGRALPRDVKVTCIVGRVTGPVLGLDEHDLGLIFASGALGQMVGTRDAGVIEDEIGRLSRELGDGVVPMSSAVLEGTNDVVVLNANHRAMVRTIELGDAIRRINGQAEMDEPPAIAVVVDRLGDQ